MADPHERKPTPSQPQQAGDVREAAAKIIDPHFRLRSSAPESAGKDNLALAKADRLLAFIRALPAPEVTEEVESLRFKADYWKRMHDEVRAALTAALQPGEGSR